MAGPNTMVLCAAMESLGLVRDDSQQGPPGSGVPYKVTDDTMAKFRDLHKDGHTVRVQDSGDVTIE